MEHNEYQMNGERLLELKLELDALKVPDSLIEHIARYSKSRRMWFSFLFLYSKKGEYKKCEALYEQIQDTLARIRTEMDGMHKLTDYSPRDPQLSYFKGIEKELNLASQYNHMFIRCIYRM